MNQFKLKRTLRKKILEKRNISIAKEILILTETGRSNFNVYLLQLNRLTSVNVTDEKNAMSSLS